LSSTDHRGGLGCIGEVSAFSLTSGFWPADS